MKNFPRKSSHVLGRSKVGSLLARSAGYVRSVEWESFIWRKAHKMTNPSIPDIPKSPPKETIDSMETEKESTSSDRDVCESALQYRGEKTVRGIKRKILKGLDLWRAFSEGGSFVRVRVFCVFCLGRALREETLFSCRVFWGRALVFKEFCGALAGIRISGMHSYLLVIIVGLIFYNLDSSSKACPGRFVNPATDICWSCLFPLSIGPVNINRSGREDTPNLSTIPCFCPRPPIPM